MERLEAFGDRLWLAEGPTVEIATVAARALCAVAAVALMACGAEADRGAAARSTPSEETTTEATPEPTTRPGDTPDPVAGPNLGPPPEADRRCAADDDCAVGHDECANDVGVRRDRAEAYEETMAPARAGASCEARLGLRGPWDEAVAFCADGLCRAVGRGYRCASHEECEVVGGGCGNAEVVNRSAVPEVRESLGRYAARATGCSGLHGAPLVPRCVEHACVGMDLGLAELRRGCRGPSDCVAVIATCNRWKVVSRRHLEEARRVFAEEGAGLSCNDSNEDEPPPVACINDYCVPAL